MPRIKGKLVKKKPTFMKDGKKVRLIIRRKPKRLKTFPTGRRGRFV